MGCCRCPPPPLLQVAAHEPVPLVLPWGLPPHYWEASSGGGSGGEVQGVCVCVCVVHSGSLQALRERGKPHVQGTVGAPAPQSCLVVQSKPSTV